MEVQDANPLERARKELHEETGFTENEVTLIRSGNVQVLVDETINTKWIIHPFLFQLKSPEFESRMQINWEHTEFKWINPKELSAYQTVPSLVETLDRVLHASSHDTKGGE
jgi:8-oxo-dGTP pyrophosphatase MutT (NUDIX family)